MQASRKCNGICLCILHLIHAINKAEETSPWTSPLDLVHGPLCGSGLWTTPVDLPYF